MMFCNLFSLSNCLLFFFSIFKQTGFHITITKVPFSSKSPPSSTQPPFRPILSIIIITNHVYPKLIFPDSTFHPTSSIEYKWWCSHEVPSSPDLHSHLHLHWNYSGYSGTSIIHSFIPPVHTRIRLWKLADKLVVFFASESTTFTYSLRMILCFSFHTTCHFSLRWYGGYCQIQQPLEYDRWWTWSLWRAR